MCFRLLVYDFLWGSWPLGSCFACVLKHVCFGVRHYSPNTIYRHYSSARGAMSARCLVCLNQVWFLVLVACLALYCLYACVWVWAKILAKGCRLGLGLVWAWPSESSGLGFGWLLGRFTLPLSFLFGFSLSLPSSLKAQNLNTIHPPLRASFSPLVGPPFRVGLGKEHLLAPGYVWTPRSRSFVKASGLGFGKRTRFEVSGPYRTNPLHEFGW